MCTTIENFKSTPCDNLNALKIILNNIIINPKTFVKVINHGILSAQIEEIIKILIPSGIVGISLTNKISKYHIKIITKKSFEESKLQDADLHLIRTAVAQKLNLPYETLTVVIHQIADNSLNATAMCEKIKDMMMKGAKAQSAARSTLRLIMKSQPIGAEIKISGNFKIVVNFL